ncbi:hypothetical protein C8J55DRAFT_530148 [Lentinula edodes]|uniref:Uncharacterized protein n=1 Tax=Lentinula lateritia TaxID=40482 RepID=A0A9W9DDC8_9AGAR|nr:hypothetical protein C8J55DRAFT_530144 [Lentinula edodes]KAJ4464452.1 hypothetical protein C8J55DRAFT_530148 [Lentinula edodes]
MPHPVSQEATWTPIPQSNPMQYTRPLLGIELIHEVACRFNDGLGDVCMGVVFKTTLPNDKVCLRMENAVGRLRST